MAPRKIVCFVGFVLIIIGVFSPLISPLGFVNWNLFDLNKTFALILQVVAMSGIISNFKKRPGFQKKIVKLNACIALGLVILIFIAAVVKVKTAFSFIPFPKLSHTLSGLIHYRWGWYLLFVGSILSVLGSFRNRKSLHTNTN